MSCSSNWLQFVCIHCT